MTKQNIHARAVAGFTALGLLALAATPAWAHKNDTTTTIQSMLPNPATQGDIVTITAEVTFDGDARSMARNWTETRSSATT